MIRQLLLTCSTLDTSVLDTAESSALIGQLSKMAVQMAHTTMATKVELFEIYLRNICVICQSKGKSTTLKSFETSIPDCAPGTKSDVSSPDRPTPDNLLAPLSEVSEKPTSALRSRQTDTHTHRQADRQADRQTDTETDGTGSITLK